MPASLSSLETIAARSGAGSAASGPSRHDASRLDVHYVPHRLPAGVVVGVWGHAVMRQDDGSVRPIKIGDVVLKGDVLLTSQKGIVEITLGGDRIATNLLPLKAGTGDPDLDRVIAKLDDGEIDFSTGAGLGDGGSGGLQPGLVVDRVVEVVSPQEYAFAWDQQGTSTDLNDLGGLGATGTILEPADLDATVRIDGPATVVEGEIARDYTVTLSHPSGVDVTVQLVYAGAAAAGADYTPVLSVTIPAGQMSARFDLPTLDDPYAEGEEPLTVALGALAGGDFATLSADPQHASVTTLIVDDAGPGRPPAGPEDTCLVSIAGPD